MNTTQSRKSVTAGASPTCRPLCPCLSALRFLATSFYTALPVSAAPLLGFQAPPSQAFSSYTVYTIHTPQSSAGHCGSCVYLQSSPGLPWAKHNESAARKERLQIWAGPLQPERRLEDSLPLVPGFWLKVLTEGTQDLPSAEQEFLLLKQHWKQVPS